MYEKCILEAKNHLTIQAMHWLSRVPATIKEAKTLLNLPDCVVIPKIYYMLVP
jgi:hypothetical protein